MISARAGLRISAAALLAAAVGALAFLVTLAAHGQPASAPASQVAVPLPVGKGWFAANAGWVVPLGIWLLANVATVLSKYPKARGVVTIIRLVLGGLSMFEFKDGKRPGLVLKLPVAPPAPPPNGGDM